MKKAIVIGATSGIGRDLAKVLSENNYIVGLTRKFQTNHSPSASMFHSRKKH